MPAAALNCRHCVTPLDALARRRGAGICGAARCRHLADQARTARIRQATGRDALAAARAQGLEGNAPEPLLVWLEHHEPQLVPLGDDERQRHQAHLEAVIADGMLIDTNQLAGATADDSHPQGARLCGQCRGRCCQAGAGWRAFIDLKLLQRWCAEHPGQTLQDAAAAYLQMLPPEHVQGGCLYQTEQGCAMPRERRADICNGFACPPLQEVQHSAAEQPQRAVVAVTFHQDRVERAALIDACSTRALVLQAAPDPAA